MTESARVRVAVIFGGQSSEHSISCLSAASILSALDPAKYDITAIGIKRDGQWVEVTPDPDHWRMVDGVLPAVTSGNPVVLAGDPTRSAENLPGQLDVDVVFPVLHGAYGEDGTIQGLCEMAGVAYVGSGVLASAAVMDKTATKAVLSANGIPVGRYVAVNDSQWRAGRERIFDEIAQLEYPLFVKPARAGSSVGITKVHSPAQLPDAIDEARHHDSRVIVEQSIEGAREIECGVLVRPQADYPEASVCAEIVVGDEHEFYNFAAKYLDDTTSVTVPARLDPNVTKEIQKMAIRAFEIMDCEGLARVDFLVSENEVIVNELNTMPGFTEISMFPRMWGESGLSYPELVDTLIMRALSPRGMTSS